MPQDATSTPRAEPVGGLLASLPGWRAERSVPRSVELEGVRYTVTPLARRRGSVALSCEPPLGEPLPCYALRSRLHPLLAALYPRPLTIFSDAARTAEVWCWSTGGGGHDAHHERVRWPGLPLAASAAEELRWVAAAPPPGPEIPSRAAIGVADAILKLAGAGVAAESDPLERLRIAIADPAGPSRVREVWRAALALRVLDPACGTGGWLLEAMAALARVYAACLEQMQVWVAEAALARVRRRPEYLRDFREALARAGESRDRFLTETILLLNLYGVERDARAAATCRRRVRAKSGAGTALTREYPRIVTGDPNCGFATRGALASALAGAADADETLRGLVEATEALGRADRLLVAERLAGRLEDGGLASGIRLLAERRAALRWQLDDLAYRAAGGDPGDHATRRRWIARSRPLHGFLEWSDASGFHLVRGEIG